MKWPWTSVARVEDAQREVAFLRAENVKLTDALLRVGRREAGLPEVPREPRPIAPVEEMPRPLREYILRFANTSVQRSLREQAIKRHNAGASWEEITKLVMKEDTAP